jgi:hypothetical protein
VYFGLSPEEKTKFRSQLAQIAEVSKQFVAELSMFVKVHMHEESCDDEGNVIHEVSVTLSPSVMLRAVDAWDKAEEFTPKGFGTVY